MKSSEARQQFDVFMDDLIVLLTRSGDVEQARFSEAQREWWWLVWDASRHLLVVTNPFPAQMGDPDAAWAREVAGKSLRAQGLMVIG